MTLLSLVWNYLKWKPFTTVLNIFLLGLGIAVITILLLFNNQIQEKITKNSKGIDLVVQFFIVTEDNKCNGAQKQKGHCQIGKFFLHRRSVR